MIRPAACIRLRRQRGLSRLRVWLSWLMVFFCFFFGETRQLPSSVRFWYTCGVRVQEAMTLYRTANGSRGVSCVCGGSDHYLDSAMAWCWGRGGRPGGDSLPTTLVGTAVCWLPSNYCRVPCPRPLHDTLVGSPSHPMSRPVMGAIGSRPSLGNPPGNRQFELVAALAIKSNYSDHPRISFLPSFPLPRCI